MPSFSIEAPAEANPLTETTLLHVLESASSSNSQQIQTGTKQLQQWETAAGYYKHLQSVFIARSLPVEVRYLAIIQLKNGIDKYWRKTATNAVNPVDKAAIRSRLIASGLDEYDQRLALQNALVIAKVVRFEYPNEWPNAINTSLDALRSFSQTNADPVKLNRALLMLLHIIKELATGRLQRTRQSLQTATPEIIAVLGRIYVDKVHSWQSSLQNGVGDSASVSATMEQSLLAIKVLRRLLVAGYEFPNRNSDVHEFWGLTSTQVGLFIGITSHQAGSASPELLPLVEKHLLQLSKLHLEMAKTHPAAFVLLPNSIDLVKAYWSLIKRFGDTFGSKEAVLSSADTSRIGSDGDQGNDTPVMEKLSLKGLLLIRACVKMVFSPAQTFKYRHAQEKEEKTQAETQVRQGLLARDFVEDLMNVIVTKFFVFRESDLRGWEEEPEEWERREESEGEGFEFSIRPCSEKLFLDLAINFKDVLIQPLLAVFGTVATLDNDDILFKDSVYSAIGLSAAVIHQQLDFNGFLSSTLVGEVQTQRPGYNILRRRIAILLGQWITVSVSQENRPLVYQIFQHILDPDDPMNDQVVRVTAGRQFKNIADDWEFQPQQFMPYAQTIMTRLMRLIEEVELTETKMALLNTISVLVEHLEHHIAPYADQIITLLPPLWEQSGEEHLMKQAILAILARLVNALRSASVPFHSMLIPIIQGAVEPGSETQLYLLEDALDLWSAMLIQSPAPASSELLSLAPYLFSIFELGSESLRRALEITESYMLLAPQDILSDNMRKPLLSSLASLVGSLKPEASGLVNNQIEIVIRAAEALGGEEAVSAVTSDLISSGFLAKQLSGLRGSWTAHCTTGPLAKAPSVDGVIETDYFSVLARLLLASPPIFLQAIQAAAPAITAANDNNNSNNSNGKDPPTDLEASMKWLLEEWFSHLENIGDPAKRKLMALALTKLFGTAQPFVLSQLQLLMSTWTDVITELREDAVVVADGDTDPARAGGGGGGGDSLVYVAPEAPSTDVPEAPEDGRRRRLTYSDPVHTVSLAEFVRAHVQFVVGAVGGEAAFADQWLANVDRDVVAAFGTLGVI